jgi:hypothetical protein
MTISVPSSPTSGPRNHRSDRDREPPVTDYADAALDNALSSIYPWILPDQIQLVAELA